MSHKKNAANLGHNHQNTYPDCNLEFLKCSSEADLEQVVNHLGRDDL